MAQSLANRLTLDLSTLLALEGLNTFDSPEAWLNLTSDLGRLPEVRWTRHVDGRVSALAATPDATRLALLIQPTVETQATELSIWDVEAWKPVTAPVASLNSAKLGPIPPWYAQVAFSPDGRRVGFIQADGSIGILDVESGKVTAAPAPTPIEFHAMAWRSTGNLLRWVDAAYPDLEAWSWDLEAGSATRAQLDPGSMPFGEGFFGPSLALDPTGTWVVVTDPENGLVRVFDPATGKPAGSVVGSLAGFSSVADHLIARSGNELSLSVYTLPGLEAEGSPIGISGQSSWAELAPAGDRVFSWGSESQPGRLCLA